MRISTPRKVSLLAVALALLLVGCTQPGAVTTSAISQATPTTAPPATATPVPTVAPPAVPDTEDLADQLATQYGFAPDDPNHLVVVQQLDSVDGQPLFVAYTIGQPPNDDSFLHKVSLHAPSPDGWTEQGRLELECVNYLIEDDLTQVAIEPSNVWLTVQGGAGAHSGCFELLRWDGQSLEIVLEGFNSSPDAGQVTDLDGDGQLDVLLNDTDPYISCYACGIRRYAARIFYWDGQGLMKVVPRRLASSAASDLRALNEQAVDLAEARLFADALAQIEQAEALAPTDPTLHWNAVWIRHHLEASRQLASTSPFPLLNHVFAGDWDTAFDALWAMGLPVFISDTPVDEAEAFINDLTVGEWLVQSADKALLVQPQRAAIHALAAWGRYLLNREDPTVAAGFEQAAQLAATDPRYQEIMAAFASQTTSQTAKPKTQLAETMQDGELTRLLFAPGSTCALLETTLQQGVTNVYVLHIDAGQTIFIRVLSGQAGAWVTDMQGTPMMVGAGDGYPIPTSGDYQLHISGSGPVQIEIEIPAK